MLLQSQLCSHLDHEVDPDFELDAFLDVELGFLREVSCKVDLEVVSALNHESELLQYDIIRVIRVDHHITLWQKFLGVILHGIVLCVGRVHNLVQSLDKQCVELLPLFLLESQTFMAKPLNNARGRLIKTKMAK